MQKQQASKSAKGNSPTRKRRSPEEIRQRVAEAAREEFSRNGFTGATTAAIARRAEVTEAQLFRYYESKGALFREAVFEWLDRHLSQFNVRHNAQPADGRNIRDQARLYISELQSFIEQHSRLFLSLVVAEAYAPEDIAGVGEVDSLHAYFERGAATMTERLQGRPRVDPKLMVRVSFAAVLANVIFKDWIFPRGLASDKEIDDAIVDFVIEGINANEDPGLAEADDEKGDSDER